MKNLLEHYYPVNEHGIRVDMIVEKPSAYRCKLCNLINDHKKDCPIKIWEETEKNK